MITFNANEILEIARQIERNGAKFYQKASQNAAAESSKDTLRSLAEMEVDHERTFKAMQDDLTASEKKPTTFDPDDVSGPYLQASADGKIFDYNADPSERLTGSESLADILSIAVGLEKDSVVFYHSVKNMVPDATGKGRVDGIIEQEMGHIILLSDLLASQA